MPDIHIFRPTRTQYGALIAFCEGLKKGFKAIHLDAELVLYHDDFKRAPITIGFNGPSRELEDIKGRKLIGETHFSLLVDAPWRFPLLLNDPDIIMGLVDLSHLRFSSRFKDKVFFCPHAVDSFHPYNLNKKRKYDIVMPLSYYPLESLKTVEGYEQWIESFVDEVLQNSELSYLDYFLTKVTNGMPFEKLLYAIEERLRFEGQEKVFQALEGREVHLFGKGTEKIQRKGFIGHGEKTFYELRSIYEETHTVINTSPKMREGGHERIFEAIAAGAKVITDENLFLKGKLDVPMFHYSHIDSLKELLETKMPDSREKLFELFSYKKMAENIMKQQDLLRF
ncbi:MAG: hypothetical protein ACK4HV_00095 [Parachlamydiaceae bacterium]